ncbi:hypothetical protein KUCAC02_028701 [Chaenocephalus aceratus]|uniref:Uncharacterized protein n=1 Tax=Chaenocephalus aceratus TaxID=36190 RepID=A0ACB9X4E6_CHAAC|nr:hypothetical protein KUCAC02_028701 [Chaenocephalus aceratus]
MMCSSGGSCDTSAKYSYKNALNQDLWDSLANTCSEEDFISGKHCYSSSQASKNAYLFAGEHLDLTAMMNTWILQKDRFLRTVLPSDPLWSSLQKGFLWHIPLTYKTDASNTIHRHLMTTQTDSIHIGEEVSWVKVNTDMTGYYVVHYEDGGWDKMTKLLRQNHTALSYKDRTQLIHNAFQLVTAGHLSLDKGLDLIGLGSLQAFYHMIEKRNEIDVTRKLRCTSSDVERRGSVSERRLRSELLSLACHLDDPPCLERARQSFKHWLQSKGTLNLPTDVAKTVFSVGAREDRGWASLLHTYNISSSAAQKSKILFALTCSRDANKLHRLLELGLEGKKPQGHRLAWNFVKKNWDTLVQRFQLGSSCISSIIIGTTGHFSSPEELAEVQLFFESIKEQASQLRATRKM